MLIVKCNLEMVPGSKIVVWPGGKLVVDGGQISNARYNEEAGLFNPPWKGVEVWGSSTEDQDEGPNGLLLHQGLVEIINGGVIENAEIGVYLGKPGDPTASGGVLRMDGTSTGLGNTIRNCRTSVKVAPYAHLSPPGPIQWTLYNQSKFAFANFEWDENYAAIHGTNEPVAHVDMEGAKGLRFFACDFTNSRTDAAGSSQLGYGIRAIDSDFTVTSACADGTTGCPVTNQLPSTFTGLDVGVHATNATAMGRTIVQRSSFVDNVCGIYVNGQYLPTITDNNLTIGGRAVDLDNVPLEELWTGRHRGIFVHLCNGLRITGNTLAETSDPYAETEGIVVGYTTTGSETVRANTVGGTDRGFVGEGICASTTLPTSMGLQFFCNTNAGNDWDVVSRIADGAVAGEQQDHTIRTHQGTLDFAADNYLDNCLSSTWDVNVNTQATITYFGRTPANYHPECYTPILLQPYVPTQPTYEQHCRLIRSNPYEKSALVGEVDEEKLAYADLRYLYGNLIDGGSTDDVVEEIMAAWPQDYWELRGYLLSKSPYLSVEVLQQAMNKEGFPDAMRAEICIANPEATQKEGFVKWLEFECAWPLPEHLLANIVASWETKTYRFTLEAQIGQHHMAMSEAAYTLLDLVVDEVEAGLDLEELQASMQLLRSPEARYHEALLLLGQHRYAEATGVIEALPSEHELKEKEMDERGRTLTYIAFLEAVHQNGKSFAELDAAQVAQLVAFVGEIHDKPTNWASNLLCHYHGICRSPYTGEVDGTPKALPRTVRRAGSTKPLATLVIHPNPANAWVAFSFDLLDAAPNAWLCVQDLAGRRIFQQRLAQAKGQVVMDSREAAPGAYVVELRGADRSLLKSEKLIINP